jgi:hypothetical protein
MIMKKSLLTAMIFSVIMVLAMPLMAVFQDYTFTQSTGTYTEITGGVSLGTETTDDQRFLDPATPAGGTVTTGPGFPIGFNFMLNEYVFDVIAINANGWISFGQSSLGTAAVNNASSSSYTPLPSTSTIAPEQLVTRVAGFARDLQAQTGATIRMETIGTAPNRVCVIQWKDYKRYGTTGTGDYINFQIRLNETTNKVTIAYGAFTIGATASTSYPQVGMRGSAPTDFIARETTTDWTLTTAATVNTATCAFATGIVPPNGLMFEYTPPVPVINDLQALSITGPTGPAAGTLATYTVSIRNRGTAAQSTYTVNLMSGTNVLATVPGVAVQSLEIVPVTVSYTFPTAGPIQVFGKVILTGDEIALNNETAPLSVVVQPSGTQVVEIGTGTSTQRQPFGIYWGYERDASLYTSTEIGLNGALTAVKWYCATPQAAVAPYKIYARTTTDAALVATPWDTFVAGATLLQEGTMAFSQAGWVTFNLTTPYAYTAGNLIIMVETFFGGTGTASYPYFRYTAGPTASHQYWYADTTPPTGNGTLNTSRPNIGLFFSTAGYGSLTGTVTTGASLPLEGATVSVVGTQLTTTTNASGQYSFGFVAVGPRQVTCSKVGYTTQTQNVTIVENQAATLNFVMVGLSTVTVTGTVVGSDAPTVGILGATVALTGMADYTATTNAQGMFTINGVYANQTYAYTVTATGYSQASGTTAVGATNHSMGTITVNEITFPASGVQATEAGANVNLSWTAPNPNVQNLTESFEGDVFPPTGWSQTILDTGAANTYGVFPTWCRVGSVALTPPVAPQDGAWQAGMWWSYNHQDEWLKTPQFTCPPAASIIFKSYVYLGSTNGDHYYVKVSTNNGSTWTPLWDASTQPGAAWNAYATNPITISLANYAGQDIKVAWHAEDPASNDGMWYTWFIDSVFIGSPARTITFDWNQMEVKSARPNGGFVVMPQGNDFNSKGQALGIEPARPVIASNADFSRALVGYKVYRLLDGQELNEPAWTTLTANTISATAYADAGWGAVPDGLYKWAVKAVYTGNVMAAPAFSNAIQKLTQIGTIAGIVRGPNNVAINGATITAGTYTATSNATGAYSMQVPAGTYTVTCAANGYTTSTHTGIVVVTGQTTQDNFNLAVSTLVVDGFESYTDFAIDFAPWVNVDIDQSATYGYNGFDFPGEYGAMAFMVYNPSTTVPASTTQIGAPHGGNKMAHCWAATTPPNNDWLISQVFNNIGTNAEVRFWARSLTDEYGLERFKVGISTGGTVPSNFTFVTGASYVQAPVEWTEFIYAIPATYVGQNIRIGINCVSNDAFIFMVDDFTMNLGNQSNEQPITPVITTALNGNFPNPFNPNTTISYSVKGTQPVVVEIFNTKGQKVKTLVNETKAEGNHKIAWDGTDDNNVKVSSGVYFYKMNAGKYSSSKKMILMK